MANLKAQAIAVFFFATTLVLVLAPLVHAQSGNTLYYVADVAVIPAELVDPGSLDYTTYPMITSYDVYRGLISYIPSTGDVRVELTYFGGRDFSALSVNGLLYLASVPQGESTRATGSYTYLVVNENGRAYTCEVLAKARGSNWVAGYNDGLLLWGLIVDEFPGRPEYRIVVAYTLLASDEPVCGDPLLSQAKRASLLAGSGLIGGFSVLAVLSWRRRLFPGQ